MGSWEQAVLELLQENGCKPWREGELICATLRGQGGEYDLYLLVKHQMLVSVARWPKEVPDERQMEMAHFCIWPTLDCCWAALSWILTRAICAIAAAYTNRGRRRSRRPCGAIYLPLCS